MEAGSVAGRTRLGDDPDLTEIGHRMLADVDAIGLAMADRIRARVPVYAGEEPVDRAELASSCAEHAKYVFEALQGRIHDDHVATENGRLRAQQGLPLADLSSAYRIGTAHLWELVAERSGDLGVPATSLVRIASEIFGVQSSFSDAMLHGYRAHIASRTVAREEESSALVAALLDGRLTDELSTYEVADLLGVSATVPYVVVVADLPSRDRRPLGEVRSWLSADGLSSAWRLLPDAEVGLVNVADDGALHRLVAGMRRHATGRLGIGPVFDDLRDAAHALRLARIARAGATDDRPVAVFDDDPLAVAAVADPDVMTRLARTVLAGLDEVSSDERALLLDTFRAWAAHDGSAADTAAALYCHPNTVRYRLRKLEERTGRSLGSPRAVVELCLAAAVDERLLSD